MWFTNQERAEMPQKMLNIMFNEAKGYGEELNIEAMEDWEVQNCLEMLSTEQNFKEDLLQLFEDHLGLYGVALHKKTEEKVIDLMVEDYICEILTDDTLEILGCDGETYYFKRQEFLDSIEEFILE